MDWMQTLLDVIDFRSFSSLWFWILVALAWSAASQRVLGIPYDLVLRARKQGGQAVVDLEDLVRIHVARQLDMARSAGLALAGVASFALMALLVLGLWYRVELAQALLCLAVPMGIVAGMGLATARRIEATRPEPDALYALLVRHRLRVQGVALVALFATAAWGMWTNLQVLQGF